ncbi:MULTISPECIES: DUF983 domain-containing protein [Maribacter]|jgi:uncharacterized protein (DUF983 family)|uniref:DUF983 domain-containing protein n=1 Tax=Maribacter stanieri TaxID=440514 RepID=A0A1I6HC06_9FLAO|nr:MULTISPECIES: DUF983 domain-containing protein [Maribacter]SFR52002.1 Protein of unknown function [Maribacter stanieri]|tara:strand:- start:1653 stop:2048 length:396 start_codon:yes stop_codon:yes gene_type:complete
MLKKGNKLYSILTGSCPRCHQESMYLDKNPYHMGKIFKMHERCGHCDLKYKIEPSFFYGAMYVSYGVGIAFAVAAFVIAYLFIGADLIETFIAIVITMIVFMPIIMRLSRNIWINFFISYDAKATIKKTHA